MLLPDCSAVGDESRACRGQVGGGPVPVNGTWMALPHDGRRGELGAKPVSTQAK